MNSLLAEQTREYIEKSSWIRKMFEAGLELKKVHGADAVYDFSLGNPDLEPPDAVKKGLEKIAADCLRPYAFGYMPNAGYPEVRAILASWLAEQQGVAVQAEDLLLTCGAAGALNVLFKAVLEPGDEVFCPAPYFVEYSFYTHNHGGVFRPVASAEDFSLDLQAIEEALTEKTRVFLLNSPNNPTGQIYSAQELEALAGLLADKSRALGRPIYLVADEPYRFLTYDQVEVPSVLTFYEYSLVASSFSKNLSLAGERIGFLLLNPSLKGKDLLMDGLVLANRILGFVNAPAIGQQVLKYALTSEVDLDVYRRRRKLMQQVLSESGYEFLAPKGGFYFFPRAPGGDDLAFVDALQDERILAVPGAGFGAPGFFRLSFCVPEKVILGAARGFGRCMKRFVA